MAIRITNLGASDSGGAATAPDFNDNADATSYSNASWTPPTTGLVLLFVYNTRATTLGSAPTVTGNGVTWSQRATNGIDTGAQTHRLTCYAALGSALSAGATTADFAGDTQSSCCFSFVHVTGVDVSGGVAGAIVQIPTATSNSTSVSVSLSAAGNSSNRALAGVGHGQPEDATARTNWTRLDSIYNSTPGHALLTQWRPDAFETTASGSWVTSGAGVIVALELKELAANETKTVTNTVGLTDALTKAAGRLKTLSDTVGLTTSVSKVSGWIRTISNNLGLTDIINASFSAGSTAWTYLVQDAVGLTDLANRAIVIVGEAFLRGSRMFSLTLEAARELYKTLRGSVK